MTARVEGVRRIAVLRPNAVGDFVFALPALHALRDAYPQAQIVYLGKRWHRDFLSGRPGPWDEVIALPAIPGVGAPLDAETAGSVDPDAIERCVQDLRERRFDLAIQLFGGGAYSNPFLRRLQARLTAGLRADDAPALDRNLPYVPMRNERARLLEVVSLVGATAPESLSPPLAVMERDHAELRDVAPTLDARPLVVLQPGATDARRRWSVQRFAEVGDRLAAEGAQLAINGGPDEVELGDALARALQSPVLDLTGRLSMNGLAALLSRAVLVVSNDTGPLHLAQALGTRTVGIYWFMNLLVSGPLVGARHREAFSARLHCPVCGVENLHARCAHEVSFIDDVPASTVIDMALAQWKAARGD